MAVLRRDDDPLVRPPVPGDVRRLEELERACFPDPWPAGVIVAELGAPARFHRVLVRPDGELVAYIFCAWQYLDLHVLKVATDPASRRRGLASRLLELARRHALERGGESLTLEVRPSNRGAIAMYRALGYRRVGLRPRYYGDGEDALVMTLELPGVPSTPGKE